MSRAFRSLLVVSLCAWVFGASSAFADQRVIVRTMKPYEVVKQRIAELGGTVVHEFKHADGLVVDMPDGQLDAVEQLAGVAYVLRDQLIPNPRPRHVADLSSEQAMELAAETLPANYHTYNSELTGMWPLQQDGFVGQGVVVGIIDSGVSQTATALCVGPCATGSRVIGGENFVPGATEPGATAATNNPHGTWVATMIGANAAFGFARTGRLATSIRNHCSAVSELPCSFPASATVDGVSMIGQAPAVQFYAFKVFPAAGGGAPTSRILQAMDRAVELKNTTLPNMKVVNMSLGGPTLHAGLDIEDELAASMAASGISLVTSAGNAGPSGITVGSPGTARNILTVGAASSAVHERILRDVQFGLGIGVLYRPDSSQQIVDFSSRGPNADGRVGPDVVANGFASFAQGANGTISLVSGTSFAAPTIAGVAAALYSYKPFASPAEIRSAIIRSARPNVVPTASAVDQGAGYVDAVGARALIDSGVPLIGDPAPARKNVSQNVHLGIGVRPIESAKYSARLANLRPAERREFFYVVDKDTAKVRVRLSNLARELPPGQQNAFFGDDLMVAVHSAKTSAIGEGDYLAFAFVAADRTFEFDRPETGLMRITVLGDWTNAGKISADLLIERETDPLPGHQFRGDLTEGVFRVHEVQIPAGTQSVTFRLSWDGDWAAYPTNDLDMILVSPVGTPNFAAATLNSPETVTIQNPVAGSWTIYVDGFTVSGKREKYQVRVDYH